MFAWIATRTGVQLPSPPVFARNVVESEDCRAVALAKADLPGYNVARASYDSASQSMATFTYVYILQSEANPNRFYTGCARDLRDRLKRHNEGRVANTSKWKPWRLKTYIAISDPQRASKLERYLKSSSGRAFIKKRL
jgi:putative endonuclease